MRPVVLFLALAFVASCAGLQPAIVTVACDESAPITIEIEAGETLELKAGDSQDCPECSGVCSISVTR